MNAKECLSQIKKADYLIHLKQKEIDRLKQGLGYKAVSYDQERVQGGKPTDKSDLICKIIDYEHELIAQVNELINLKKEIMIRVDQIKNEECIRLIYLRYFEFKSWEEIAIELKYSYRWVLKLHGKALLEFGKILKEDM